ncbi:MAG: hypothetical protein IKU10_00785, partial [Clostridia bacterium]|nr:hypothetical protein [Clostridia bacterium]
MGQLQFHEKKPLIKNKLFYVSLIACMVAFGISSYTAVSRLKQLENPNTDVPESTVSLSEVDKTVSDAPYPSEPQIASPTDTTDQESQTPYAAPYFLLPISGEVMKDFDSENLQYSETYKDWRLHLGVDLTAEKGDEVTAAAEG